MSTRNTLFGRWLLYGILASFIHLGVVCLACPIVMSSRAPFFHFTATGDVLTFPGFWLFRTFMRNVDNILPSGVAVFYNKHGVWFGLASLLTNSALWGFSIAALVVWRAERRRRLERMAVQR
jgi:hypothetical protein